MNKKEDRYFIKVKPYLADIQRYVKCGVTEGQLCQFYNVSKTQWIEYKKNHTELNEILCNGKKELKTELINIAYRTATGYDYEEITTVTYQDEEGKITSTKTTIHKRHAKADAGMIQFLLINRFSNEYARDPQMLEIRRELLKIQKQQGLIGDDIEGV